MADKPVRRLTGRHVLAITLAGFGTVIAVNATLAYFALQSFPGLEVANSYVASQGFNTRLAEQRALGWQTRVEVTQGELRLYITGPDGAPARVAQLEATLGRPTQMRDDVTPAFVPIPGGFAAPVDLAPGNWNLRLRATAPDGTRFEQRIAFEHRGSGR